MLEGISEPKQRIGRENELLRRLQKLSGKLLRQTNKELLLQEILNQANPWFILLTCFLALMANLVPVSGLALILRPDARCCSARQLCNAASLRPTARSWIPPWISSPLSWPSTVAPDPSATATNWRMVPSPELMPSSHGWSGSAA